MLWTLYFVNPIVNFCIYTNSMLFNINFAHNTFLVIHSKFVFFLFAIFLQLILTAWHWNFGFELTFVVNINFRHFFSNDLFRWPKTNIVFNFIFFMLFVEINKLRFLSSNRAILHVFIDRQNQWFDAKMQPINKYVYYDVK